MMRMNRRGFLAAVGAGAGTGAVLAGPFSLRALAGTTARVAGTAATPYTWAKVIDGGGFCNVVAADPANPGHAAAGGDVWGEHTTASYGNLWTPTMTGAGGIGDIYARSVAYSLANPGVAYFGIGTLKGGAGKFCAVSGLQLQVRSRTVGFGTRLASGAAGSVPRAVGSLIQVDLDLSAGTEYVYALTNRGLARSTDGGRSWAVLGLTSVPAMAWAALCLAPDGSLYAASYRTSATGGSQVWQVTSPRTVAAITAVLGTPPVVEDMRTVNGRVLAACGASGLYAVTAGSWSPVASGFFAGCHLSSVDGLGNLVYVGSATFPKKSQKCIAVSSDGGATFRWSTGAANVSQTVAGTSRTWWLSNGPTMPGDHYSVSQLAVDRFNPAVCYSAGRAGVWATRNGGASWQPAMNGLGGSEVNGLRVGTTGQVFAADTDWTGIATQDNWQNYARTLSPGAMAARSLSRTVGGNAYQLVTGVPRDLTLNGSSIADGYFRAACISPTDLQVSADGHVSVGLFGGGVLVGTP